MSMQRIVRILENYGGLAHSSAEQIERGLAGVMTTAAKNFRIEDDIPHEITTTTDHDGVTVNLGISGAWRRALHENPRFRGYKFLERAWLEHRDDIVRLIVDEIDLLHN